MGLFGSLRLRQWTKNLLVFAGLLFSGRLTDRTLWLPAVGAFGAFCLLASAVYLLNDLWDREQDRQHPRKCHRPIAAGILPPPVALAAAGFLSLAGLFLAFCGGMRVGYLGAGYLVLNLAYIIKVKEIPLLDIFSVAMGFVLRAVTGVVAVGVELSPWFVLCTVLLSLLLVLGKRRQELVSLAVGAAAHRKVLGRYSQVFLDQMISIIATATLVSYSLYTFFSEAGRHHSLMWTIPPVLYGLFRYLYLVYEEGRGGEPEEILLHDPGILGSVLLWVLSILVILYFL
ncbi:MAG TPA: decaprenyl-phosphate phosphoribosyltransferase [Firmicutes bacterium]|nr:decaprenyl-phosphate phosphoribosyltransferase [Bacillota bacterium]